MIPYTLVLKPGLVIFSVYNGYWFWGRPSFEDLRRDLREVGTGELLKAAALLMKRERVDQGPERSPCLVPALRGFGVEGSLPPGQRGGGGGLAADIGPVGVIPV